MDTAEFQRLDRIQQLGGSSFVFPSATHTRKEHSIGTSHLAGLVVRHLREAQPSLNIDDADVLCVQLAALLHDCGHGPHGGRRGTSNECCRWFEGVDRGGAADGSRGWVAAPPRVPPGYSEGQGLATAAAATRSVRGEVSEAPRPRRGDFVEMSRGERRGFDARIYQRRRVADRRSGGGDAERPRRSLGRGRDVEISCGEESRRRRDLIRGVADLVGRDWATRRYSHMWETVCQTWHGRDFPGHEDMSLRLVAVIAKKIPIAAYLGRTTAAAAQKDVAFVQACGGRAVGSFATALKTTPTPRKIFVSRRAPVAQVHRGLPRREALGRGAPRPPRVQALFVRHRLQQPFGHRRRNRGAARKRRGATPRLRRGDFCGDESRRRRG